MIITKSNLQRQGKNLLFEAYTLAPTLGWQNVVLSKTEYVKPPVNGIQDFVLTLRLQLDTHLTQFSNSISARLSSQPPGV